MITGFIAKKLDMQNVYLADGKRIAVTRLIASPLKITSVRTTDKHGYSAVQIAFGNKKNQPAGVSALLKKLKLDISPRKFKEFRLTTEQVPEVGADITFESVFNNGEKIKATAVSKGRGFAGVIKRYGFQRQPVTGGQSDRTRAPGAIGAQTPGKVLKGKKMPGHYGNSTTSVSNLKIHSYNPETHELLLTGSIPGPRNSWVTISKINS